MNKIRMNTINSGNYKQKKINKNVLDTIKINSVICMKLNPYTLKLYLTVQYLNERFIISKDDRILKFMKIQNK